MNYNDIIGKKFGILTVKKYIRSEYWSKEYKRGFKIFKSGIKKKKSGYHYFYECQCNCGNIIITTRVRLKDDDIKSCGCLNHKKLSENKGWKGCGDLSGYFWNQIKGNVKRSTRTLPFEITMQDAWNKFIEQEGKCALTGLKLELPAGNIRKGGWKRTASLDRINSELGYINGNIQWVHKQINQMKWNFTEERFIELCILVANYYTKVKK